MKGIAIALIVIGLCGVIYDLAGFGRNRATMEVGGMTASVTEEGGTPVIAILGGIALVGGIVMFANDRRRSS